MFGTADPSFNRTPYLVIKKDSLLIWMRNQNDIYISAIVLHILSCPFKVQYAQVEENLHLTLWEQASMYIPSFHLLIIHFMELDVMPQKRLGSEYDIGYTDIFYIAKHSSMNLWIRAASNLEHQMAYS